MADHRLPELRSDDLDTAAIRARYDAERQRRLRADGAAQYVEIAGRHQHYRDDPWAGPAAPRDAVRRTVDVLIIGGGYSGLLASARLREAGFDDLLILEQAADFGGTWYWNRYPGAACDTESYIYMPLLEETGYLPSAKYAKGPELWEQARRVGRHYGLYDKALFQTVVTDLRWDDAAARWVAITDRGDALQARFVVLAGGLLHRPKLPGIPGIDDYQGHSFHTSRWDYGYTGGDPTGQLTGLADKRVGIIGTGATAVQCVPHLGRWAKELYVFQRTPSSVDVRNDRPTDPEWARSLTPGWQARRMANFSTVVSGGDFDEDLVNDGWTDIIGNILLTARRRARAGETVDDPETLIQQADYRKMERVRARVDAIVSDPATAAALKPWYDQFCKRPCFHDEYLPTFNRPNVHLVDTEGRGVTRITARGVVVGEREYPLDCIVYGTGFEVGTDYTRRVGFEITGRDGRTLTDKWQDGTASLHGLWTRGFPNLAVVATMQTGASSNFQHMLAEQARHIAYVLKEVSARGVRSFEPEQAAEDAWVETIVRLARLREPYLKACTPGYYNAEGQYGMKNLKNAGYGRGPDQFLKLMDTWRSSGTLSGLELVPR